MTWANLTRYWGSFSTLTPEELDDFGSQLREQHIDTLERSVDERIRQTWFEQTGEVCSDVREATALNLIEKIALFMSEIEQDESEESSLSVSLEELKIAEEDEQVEIAPLAVPPEPEELKESSPELPASLEQVTVAVTKVAHPHIKTEYLRSYYDGPPLLPPDTFFVCMTNLPAKYPCELYNAH